MSPRRILEKSCRRRAACASTGLAAAVDHAAHYREILVADAGGIIGAGPAGIGSTTLADFGGQIFALVDAVGIEHVAIGTDMDANYKPVLTDYTDFPLLAAALLAAGIVATRTTPAGDRPRGPFCMMGACFDCLAVVDGQRSVQTCLTPVREGMKVERQGPDTGIAL